MSAKVAVPRSRELTSRPVRIVRRTLFKIRRSRKTAGSVRITKMLAWVARLGRVAR